MVLGERAGVFPITETDSGAKRRGFRTLARRKVFSPVVIRASSEVENDSEDNKADDGQDLDGTIDTMQLLVRISSAGGIVLNRMPTNAKMNSASPYAPIKVLCAPEEDPIKHQRAIPAPSMLITMTTTTHTVIQAAGLTTLFQ